MAVTHPKSKLLVTKTPTTINFPRDKPTSSTTIIAKGDSAASNHYLKPKDAHILLDKHKATGPPVSLPNSDLISSNEAGWLPIPKLSKEATHASVLPQLKTSSLISLGQLCDDDCTVLLHKKKLFAVKDNELLLQGNRNHQD